MKIETFFNKKTAKRGNNIWTPKVGPSNLEKLLGFIIKKVNILFLMLTLNNYYFSNSFSTYEELNKYNKLPQSKSNLTISPAL
ncbi:hypothetical protein OMHANJPE_00383 [Mycoplasmopsis arginini]|nr:hypothetical protein [Mycoplasmopsis arginini]